MSPRYTIWTVALWCTALLYAQAASIQDCYYYDGTLAPNNTVCANSGACCGNEATCTDERLCHNPGDNSTTFVRGPCVRADWSSTDCPQICLYDESGGVFPRVKQCNDGSWCCYNLYSGDNGDTCCAAGQGTFLNNNGVVINGPTSSSTTASTSSTTSTSTSSTSASASPSSDNSVGLSTGAKAGLGIGIGLGVLFIVAAGVFMWLFVRRRKRAANGTKESNSMDHMSAHNEVHPHYAAHKMDGHNQHQYSPMSEAPGVVPAEVHSNSTRFEADSQAFPPQELSADHVAYGGKRLK